MLQAVISLLRSICDNTEITKMNSTQMGMVFAAALFPSPLDASHAYDLIGASRQCTVLTYMVNSSKALFEVRQRVESFNLFSLSSEL